METIINIKNLKIEIENDNGDELYTPELIPYNGAVTTYPTDQGTDFFSTEDARLIFIEGKYFFHDNYNPGEIRYNEVKSIKDTFGKELFKNLQEYNSILKIFYDIKLERLVLAKKSQSDHFTLTEARIHASFEHPGIISVHDIAITKEYHDIYFIMELGPTHNALSDEIVQKLDKNQLKEIFYIIADAIDSMHTAGIIHGEIKPPNILIGFEGDEIIAKICDFGASSSIDHPPDPKHRFLTPIYAPPEQIKGERYFQSDTFSFAISVFRIITGFDYANILNIYEAIELQEKLKKEPDTVKTHITSPEVSAIFQEILPFFLKALDPDYQQRYATCKDFLDDLYAVLEA